MLNPHGLADWSVCAAGGDDDAYAGISVGQANLVLGKIPEERDTKHLGAWSKAGEAVQ